MTCLFQHSLETKSGAFFIIIKTKKVHFNINALEGQNHDECDAEK